MERTRVVMPLADVVDRFTILSIRYSRGMEVGDELEVFRKVVDEIDYSDLLAINSLMWDLEELIAEQDDLEVIGAICLALRHLNGKRIEARNKIATEVGGPCERKNY